MPNRKGIPTMYRGVEMRSRTEARWAALFDFIDWPWRYEPQDLDFYIPDFAIDFPAGTLLAEIKCSDEDFSPAQSKIDRSGFDGPICILGHDVDGQAVGRISDLIDGEWQWCQAQFFYCISCGSASINAFDGSWHCRACGDGYGNSHVDSIDLTDNWIEAGNRVRWKPEAA